MYFLIALLFFVALASGAPPFQSLFYAIAFYIIWRLIGYVAKKSVSLSKADRIRLEGERDVLRQRCAQLEQDRNTWRDLFEQFTEQVADREANAHAKGEFDGQCALFFVYKRNPSKFQEGYIRFVHEHMDAWIKEQITKNNAKRQKENRQAAPEPVDESWRDVLGVDKNADREAVEVAYRRLVRKWHPDKYSDPLNKQEATERLTNINVAKDQADKHFGV